MNERIESLIELSEVWNTDGDVDKCEVDLHKFAELIVRECADIARNTNLEDVEGGDSAVLCAAKYNILDHFGIE